MRAKAHPMEISVRVLGRTIYELGVNVVVKRTCDWPSTQNAIGASIFNAWNSRVAGSQSRAQGLRSVTQASALSDEPSRL